MRTFQNPAGYFFRLAQNPKYDYTKQAFPLALKIQHNQKCPLCQQNYNFTNKLPRIMVHCGHSFCQSCLVRCPQCHKLIKHIDSIQQLPINHSLFIKQAQVLQQKHQNDQSFQNVKQILLMNYRNASYKRQKKNKMPVTDPQTGLPFCMTHPDRLEHFFCNSHKIIACRVCTELCHQGPNCQIVQLYDVENIQQFLVENGQFQNQDIQFFQQDL